MDLVVKYVKNLAFGLEAYAPFLKLTFQKLLASLNIF